MITNKKIQGILRVRVYDREGNAKKVFQPNRIWKFFKKKLNVDIQIPLLTGFKSDELVWANNITAAGFARITSLLGGLGGTAITHAALGTGTPSANALGAEVTRGAVTNTQITTTVTNDTIRCTATFVISGSHSFAEEGLFDHVSAGNMLAYNTFPAIFLENGNVYILDHDIQALND